MKEKKLVLSVILGVSLVILMITLVAELIDSLTLLTDYTALHGTPDFPYFIIAGILQVVAVIIGIVSIVLPAVKKYDIKKQLSVAACFLGYIIVAAIVLNVILHATGYFNYTGYYAIYTSYLTFFATAAVTSLAYTVSSVMLKFKKAEGSADTEKSADKVEPENTDTPN